MSDQETHREVEPGLWRSVEWCDMRDRAAELLSAISAAGKNPVRRKAALRDATAGLLELLDPLRLPDEVGALVKATAAVKPSKSVAHRDAMFWIARGIEADHRRAYGRALGIHKIVERLNRLQDKAGEPRTDFSRQIRRWRKLPEWQIGGGKK